jgi:hypothetical protein
LTAVSLLRTEIDKDLKLTSLLKSKENVFPFAFENFSLLNAASRSQVRDQIANIHQLKENE